MNPEAVENNRVSNHKPPTRLQKQAPATLHLNLTPNNEPQNMSKTLVIPLLSPLVLTPASLPETGRRTEYSFLTRENGSRESKVNQATATDRWQHPATLVSVQDSSSLHTCFMSQCTIRPRDH
ncbi:hypothetical protein R6Q59_025801 [Mikania micrantha]|uniref:Uncharacterized protein n=1 Tax=Mikania micrantha TaxID=192012 RepID=A0A5N6PEE2_9ASTR|nr:hypothetical protein E3N88_11065 [Mikania micrantha]